MPPARAGAGSEPPPRVRPAHATSGTSSIGTSSAEYRSPPPREFATDASQSAQSAPNGALSPISRPRPAHHDRRRMPKTANGASDGFSSTNGAASRDPPTTASASAATDQMTGFPVQIFRSVVGFDA